MRSHHYIGSARAKIMCRAGMSALAATIFALPVAAQENAGRLDQAQAQRDPIPEASTPTPGAPDTESGGSADIVVTAQFRSQSVQRTPLSITALTGDMLRERSFTSITDIARSVPNVTMASGSGIRSGGQIFIRGIGQNDNNFALEPGVGVYVDDVYYGTTYGSAFDLVDVERVEILRGPQGTLAGGNSIGGAVKLFSQKPRGENIGYFEAAYGSFNRVDLRGAYDLALVPDQLMLRISGGLRSDKGYVRRLDFACDQPALAGSLPRANVKVDDCEIGREGGREVRAVRAALRWVPSDSIEVNLIGDVTRDTSQAGAEVLIAVATANVNAVYQAQQQALFGVRLDERFIPNRKFVSYATFADTPNRGMILDPDSQSTNWGVTAIIDWKIAENLNLKSITGYRAVDGQYSGDVDATPLNQNTEFFNQIHKQFTQEVRLSGTSLSDVVDWTVGAFYYNANDRSKGTVNVPASVPQFGGLYFQQNDPVENRNIAGFATAVVHLFEGFDLTGGYRYTDSRKVYTFSRFDPRPNGAIYTLGIDKLGRSPPSTFRRSDFRASVSYEWTGNFRTYASYTTGFKGGGVNPRPSTPAQQVPLGPETIDAYEIGFKSELFDRRLRLNGAGFINKYKDLQVSARSLDLSGVLATIFTNVGKATIKGLELEAQAEPVSGLAFNGSVSYLDFQYDDLGAALGVAGGPCITCRPVFTPTWKWNAGVQYEAELGVGTLTPRFDLDYSSKAFSDPSNRAATIIPARTVANVRLTFRPGGEPKWEAAFQVTNLFNKYYFSSVNDFIGSSQVATAQPGRPREWLLSLRRTF